MARIAQIVLAEDNPGDVRLIREALNLQSFEYDLHVQRDGEQMLDFLDRLERGEVPCPDLVLLDLNLPRTEGTEILARLHQSPHFASVPVIIVSSSDSPRDRETHLLLGAADYFLKPSDYDAFMELGSMVRKTLAAESC